MRIPLHVAAVLGASPRTCHPRKHGITVVLDRGLGPSAIADLAAVARSHWDFAKIAWGSALITDDLEQKITCYRAHGVAPLLGGTLFEYAFTRGRLAEFVELTRALGVHVEVSDGSVDIPRSDKLRTIEALSRHGEVFSEIGKKACRLECDWVRVIREELSAGASKVVIEGHEIGPPGAEIRGDLVDTIAAAIDPDLLIFEALERKQQVWLVKRLGPNVNLANVLPGDLLTVESFRRGLKEETLLHEIERTRHGS